MGITPEQQGIYVLSNLHLVIDIEQISIGPTMFMLGSLLTLSQDMELGAGVAMVLHMYQYPQLTILHGFTIVRIPQASC